MNKVIYFADATCDLPVDFIKKHNIQIIGLRYSIGEVDGWFTTADQKQLADFYARMRKGDTASTSLVLYDDAVSAFEPFFRQGYDIIHFGLSSGLAKTYENANNAGIDLAKKYGRKFYAHDTKCVSAMHVILIEYCLRIGDFDKIVESLPAFCKTVKAYFTVEDLKYLHKSGRLSGAAKVIGGLMQIKPIIKVDDDGKLVTMTKKTGRLQSIQFLANQVSQIDTDHPTVFIIHADCLDDAKLLEQKVREHFIGVKTTIIQMGFIISTHTGPGTLGLGFISK
ncbi:MAG: DegV family protein [Christensenellaceae bacterium]|jgi:DegV family protein with EDD domain|nr:DegV family protein [Christensenellaceae bacterium]